MLKALEIQALRADLGAIDLLLQGRTEDDDPIGHRQLSQRHARLTEQLATVEASVQHKAAVALFFSGGPVVGSRGIEATFAGRAVAIFQDLVSKQFAVEEIGELGRRGPVSLQTSSDMLVTNVVRGSVGLVLEEADQTDTFTDTQLKLVVDHVVDAITAAASVAGDDFDRALERMDPRFLSSLGEFFEVMHEKQALLRLVEDEREIELNAEAIRRGRERAGAATIHDSEDAEIIGRIFVLPAARRFELSVVEGEPPLTGAISREFAKSDLEVFLASEKGLGGRWKVRVRTRTVSRPTRPAKVTHTLTGMVGRVD